jgi:hypothetical protein
MKALLIILLCFLAGCKSNKCDIQLNEKYSFFENGTFGTTKTYWTLVIVQDPKDWDYNLYFDGVCFINDRSKAYQAKDTCELKKVFINSL